MRALAVVHPFPSALNALAVVGLALLAGGTVERALLLGAAMLSLQFSIGAANDFFDAELDARSKRGKPIVRGLISRPTTARLALGFAGLALALAALLADWLVFMLAAGMLLAGLAYDAVLKGTPLAGLAYAVAFPLLPVYAWYGAVGSLPPRPELLLPLAALAGPALQLANGLVDIERDRLAGLNTLPAHLGKRASLALMGALLGVVHGVAWLSLVGGGAPSPAFAALLVAAVLALGGLALSGSADTSRRERGWQAQAGAIVLLVLGWLAAVTS